MDQQIHCRKDLQRESSGRSELVPSAPRRRCGVLLGILKRVGLVHYRKDKQCTGMGERHRRQVSIDCLLRMYRNSVGQDGTENDNQKGSHVVRYSSDLRQMLFDTAVTGAVWTLQVLL